MDTGSSHTLIRASKAVQCRLARKTEVPSILRNWMGSLVQENEFAAMIVRIMIPSAELQVVIMPDDDMQYDLIVERDFLYENHVVTTISNRKISLRSSPEIKVHAASIIDDDLSGVS